MIDIRFLGDTKLDEGFPSSLFNVDNFKACRKEVTSTAGGLLCVIRSDVAHRRSVNVTKANVSLEGWRQCFSKIILLSERWLLCSLYTQPGTGDMHLVNIMDGLLNSLNECGNVSMSDLNVTVTISNHEG